MNLRAIDLNLLVVLDALLDEAHVGRAADRLGLSQPAASAALQRCRALFGDALLERGRGTMRRTPRAEALRGPLKTVLVGARDLIDPAEVPLAEIRRTLRLTMADQPATLVIAPLLADLRRSAPGLDLVFLPWHGAEAAKTGLASGAIDLAVSVFPNDEEGLVRRRLVDEHYVVAMRTDHPAAARFDLDRWLDHPHVVVSGRGERHGPVDATLARRGLVRRVGLVVPSFQMALDAVAASDLIALLPSRCVRERGDLTVVPPPLAIPGFTLHLATHGRNDGDIALGHVADRLAALFA